MKIKHVLLTIAAALLCGLVFTACDDMNNSTTGSHYDFLKTNKNKGLPEFSGAGWYYMLEGDWSTDEEFLTNVHYTFYYFDENKNFLYTTLLDSDKPVRISSGENSNTYDMLTNINPSEFQNGIIVYFGKITSTLYNEHKNYLPSN